MNGKRILLALATLAGLSLFVQAEEASLADKVTLSVEFNGSLISADSEGVIDSMADAGFNEDETKLGVAYEDELWGASASVKFINNPIRMLLIEELYSAPLALDELYAWVKPFGEHFKFTGGIFENSDGIADYTDDIDDFGMGAFISGNGTAFTEPEETTSAKLSNGFLSEATFGPITAQFLLGPNYSGQSGSDVWNGYLGLANDQALDLGFRSFHIGGRIIADLGFATAALTAKTMQWPVEALNALFATMAQGYPPPSYPGDKMNYLTFGANLDIREVENLGVSLGYTGFMLTNDADNADSVLWNGIDLRVTWTGIAGLSLSTHNNVSFASGDDWFVGDDSSFFNLYNAIGATKELTEKFSVNVEVANVLTKFDIGGNEASADHLFVSTKLITHITENVEFDAGLALDVSINSPSEGDDKTLTVFSVPVAIKVSF
jgi:hypothetical protein